MSRLREDVVAHVDKEGSVEALAEAGISEVLRRPLASTELAAVDYPQPGVLTWEQLSRITSAALASEGCAGWSVCIYNPDLDPGRQGADDIIGYLSKAIAHADGR